MFCWCIIHHTWQNPYCNLQTCSLVCTEGMSKAVDWLTCTGCFPKGYKLWCSLKCSRIEERQKMKKMPATMANPKWTQPLPKPIIHFKKQAIAHYNWIILNKWNRKADIHLQENKSNPMLQLEEMAMNSSVKHVPVKASIHLVEDHITREASVKSARIIVNCIVLLNDWIMMI